MDSNHRSLWRQIYSLLPLATREPTHYSLRSKRNKVIIPSFPYFCQQLIWINFTFFLLKIKNIDLPQKLCRKPRKDTPTIRTSRKKYGRGIEEHPACVASRERFGDWELDLAIGSNSGKDHVLMTILERKNRYYKVIHPPDKSSQSVMNAFAALKSEYGKRFSTVFKIITTDNGSEFSRLAELKLEMKQRFTMHILTPHIRKAPMNGTMVWSFTPFLSKGKMHWQFIWWGYFGRWKLDKRHAQKAFTV